MTPTEEQRNEFGRRLRDLRLQSDFRSTESLAEHLRQQGLRVTGAAVGAWERGEYAPRHVSIVDALEDALGVERGQLGVLLGYTLVEGDDRIDLVEAQLNEVVARQDQMESRLDEILRLLGVEP